jgi:hypothetical protein
MGGAGNRMPRVCASAFRARGVDVCRALFASVVATGLTTVLFLS